MTLIELFQSDTRMQGILTKIMTQRMRMRYKRDQVRATIHAYTSQVDTVTMGELRHCIGYAIHKTRRVFQKRT